MGYLCKQIQHKNCSGEVGTHYFSEQGIYFMIEATAEFLKSHIAQVNKERICDSHYKISFFSPYQLGECVPRQLTT